MEKDPKRVFFCVKSSSASTDWVDESRMGK